MRRKTKRVASESIYTYTVKIHPADRDETGYWAEVPALPGCFTQGETYEETLAMAEEAIEGFLELCVKLGKPIPVEVPAPTTVKSLVRVRVPVMA